MKFNFVFSKSGIQPRSMTVTQVSISYGLRRIGKALLAELDGVELYDLLESGLCIGTWNFSLNSLENHAARVVEMGFASRDFFLRKFLK